MTSNANFLNLILIKNPSFQKIHRIRELTYRVINSTSDAKHLIHIGFSC